MKALLTLLPVFALAACARNEEPTSTSSGNGSPTPAATTAAATAAPAAAAHGPLASALHPDLLDPAKANANAPDVFKARFTTTKGDFVVEVHRDWAPHGADRFYNLVKSGFFDDTRFFRAVDGFMVQFGISGDPAVSSKWQHANFPDDSGKQSNKRGYVTFAQQGSPNTRSTQVFINYVDNGRLDAMNFPPFGQVVQGMDVVDSFNKKYGEGAPGGKGPRQDLIQSKGNAYLDTSFPDLDAVKHAEIVK
jgi:peptidyl-prolyl cis-trans isomerase A (cyclophilin A)